MHDAPSALSRRQAALTPEVAARSSLAHRSEHADTGRELACPTCGPQVPRARFGARTGYDLARCTGCGLIFIDRLGIATTGRFFAGADDRLAPRAPRDALEYGSDPGVFDRHRAAFEAVFEERWQRLNAARPDIRRVLDIGCGHGFFLAHVAPRGAMVRGIEIDPAVAGSARERFGLAVSESPIESYATDERFDAIVMCDVLGQLADPKAALERCEELLVPGGVLLIEVPNLVGLKLPFGQSWGLPHHIWQFGPRSLSRLVAASGLQPEGWSTGVLGAVSVLDRGGPSWRDRLAWAAARRLNFGNRLMLIARKLEDADRCGRALPVVDERSGGGSTPDGGFEVRQEHSDESDRR